MTIAADFALLPSSNLLATSEKSQRRVLCDPAQHKLFGSQFLFYCGISYCCLPQSLNAHLSRHSHCQLTYRGHELCLCYSSELARGIHLNTGSHSAFQDGLKLVAICLLHAGVTGICTHAQILVQLVLQSESLVPSFSNVTSLHWVLNTSWVKRFSLWQNREQNSDSACSPKPFKPRGAVEKTRGSRRLAYQAEQSQWPQLQAGWLSKPAFQA